MKRKTKKHTMNIGAEVIAEHIRGTLACSSDYSFLQEVLESFDPEAAEDDEFEELDIDEVYTFEQAGVLTTDAGFVVKLSNGAEYQVTVVRSR